VRLEQRAQHNHVHLPHGQEGGTTAGSASSRVPRASSTASAARCRRSATWTGTSMWSKQGHGARIAALTVVGTAIVLPLVVFVLGPEHAARQGDAGRCEPGHRQHGDARRDDAVHRVHPRLSRLRALRVPGEKGRGAARWVHRFAGTSKAQVAWLATTSAAVLFLAIFGTVRLLADNGAGGGDGPNPVTEAERPGIPGPGDRPGVGVHLPLPDLRWRRDRDARAAGSAARLRST